MKENQPSYDKGGHFLRGQTQKLLKLSPDLQKSDLTFAQRRYVQRNPRSGSTPRGRRP